MDNVKKRRVLPALLCLLLGLICAKAFVINPRLYVGKSSIPADSTDYVWTFVALVFSGLFYETYVRRALRPMWGEALFGLLFGVLNYFGTTLFAYDSWAFIGKTVSWLNVAYKCLGQGFAMTAALTLVVDWLRAPAQIPLPLQTPSLLERFRRFYRKHTVVAGMLLFFVCWLPYLAVFYPGTVVSDMAFMFEQFEGIAPMTTWHGVFTTWVFGGCIWLGRLFGSDNLGCCLYMLLQTLALSYALARVMALLRRLRVGARWQLAALAFFAIVPIWPVYCTMICKDTLYTASLLLLLLQTVDLSRAKAQPKPGAYVAYGATALLCCLWRNNGLYVVLPSCLLTVSFLLRGKARLGAGGAAAGAIVLALLFQNALVPALGIIDNTASGIYSVCFQQTARVVRDHEDELTEAEKAEIDNVLDLAKLDWLYEPWISDPVKYTFRQFGQGADVEKQALTRYRAAWLQMLKKYPLSYLQAFMAGNRGYYAFTPKYDGITYSQQAGVRFMFVSYWIEGEGQLYTTQPEALDGVRNAVGELCNRWRTFPILSMLFVCPVYTWLLIACGLSLARKRRWRELALLAPATFSFAVCLVSPVDDYFRYFLPIVAMTIPLVALTARAETRAQALEVSDHA